MTGDPDDAEDVAQAVLMKTLSAIGSFDGRSRVTSWVYRITRNASLDHQREKRQEQRLAESRAPGLEDPLDDIEMKRTLRLIRTLVTELPMMQREVFDLVDLQGLRPGEAARLLEMNPNTLRVHLLRARRRMRKEMLARPVDRGTEGKR